MYNCTHLERKKFCRTSKWKCIEQKRLSIMLLLTGLLLQPSVPQYATLCHLLLQYTMYFWSMVLASTVSHLLDSVLGTSTMSHQSSTMGYLLLQCAMCFCSVVIVQNGNWQTLQGFSIHHRDSYGYSNDTFHFDNWVFAWILHSYKSIDNAHLCCFRIDWHMKYQYKAFLWCIEIVFGT